MPPFIHVRSPMFPRLAGEKEETVNEGTYGKALAEYLEKGLSAAGYSVPFSCCEDWGWWVEIKGAPFAFGVCIYSYEREGSDLIDYYLCSGATSENVWSWRKLRWLPTGERSGRLHRDLVRLFSEDTNIELLATDLDGPDYDA
ncbi:MAG TPA: hypothetical protein DDW52_02945 [Planctomycetaceae bacterium]|nr:hypothetical protein [Planctomycetaceae bacterium]